MSVSSEGPALEGSRAVRVLLAEDEEQVRMVVGKVLKRAQFDVTSANNGKEALDLLRANGSTFDILVTDMMMPVMGGIELAETVLAEFPMVRVVVMTGFAGGSDEKAGVLGRCAAVVAKPFSSADLVETLRALVPA